jgi:hypothetical protein
MLRERVIVVNVTWASDCCLMLREQAGIIIIIWYYHITCWKFSPCCVRSNPAHGEVYLIQLYVIKFFSDLRQVSGFLWVFQIPPRYNWNIVESGIKHHNKLYDNIKWWWWCPLCTRTTCLCCIFMVLDYSIKSLRIDMVFQIPPRYNWNIVESGIKHHNTNPVLYDLAEILLT